MHLSHLITALVPEGYPNKLMMRFQFRNTAMTILFYMYTVKQQSKTIIISSRHISDVDVIPETAI